MQVQGDHAAGFKQFHKRTAQVPPENLSSHLLFSSVFIIIIFKGL